jgi:PAS domain S-box-containing protein
MSENNQATLAEPAQSWTQPEHMPSLADGPWPGLLLWLLVVVLLVVLGGLWLYGEIHQAIQPPDPQHPPGAQWLWKAILFAVSTSLLLAVLAVAGYRRLREWAETQRAERYWTEKNRSWADTVRELRNQLATKRRTEAELRDQQQELEQRLQALSESSVAVVDELNRIKLAEETASQQRRDLARSKDVLELHVEERNQQLQKLQREYALILNSAGEGICGLDIEGRLTFANPAAAKMVGSSVGKLVGRPAREVFPHLGDRREPGAGGDDGERPVEVMVPRPEAATFEAEFVHTPIRKGERVVGQVLLFKDITERKRAAESLARKADELARSNAELEQFAFVASHDLQEPLRKIQAFGDRLKMKCAAVVPEEGRDYLERMQNAAARMQTLIYDLLMFSRVISRTEPFEAVDLKRVAQEVIGDLELRIEKTGGRVEVGELPTIEADASQMRQLLLNLLGNALKFHAPDQAPVVRVAGRRLESAEGPARCELTVADNGIGFDEKYLDRIFVVFQRLHGRQEYEGTGIGLAVCRRITERHGGTITARSTPGKGATFIVTLPVRQAAPAKGPA